MDRIIITPNDLIQFIGKEKYHKFIDYLAKEYNLDDNQPIWIIGEGYKRKNKNG